MVHLTKKIDYLASLDMQSIDFCKAVNFIPFFIAEFYLRLFSSLAIMSVTSSVMYYLLSLLTSLYNLNWIWIKYTLILN